MKELYLHVFGRVQGVNLRRRVASIAERLHLKGYVQNLKDGSVEILAQGKESELNELVSWLQKIHFPVKLTGMQIEWHETLERQFKKFKIKRADWLLLDEAKSFFNLGKEILNIDKNDLNIPRHVVIIPDGNRRWARERGWKAWVGHKKALVNNPVQAMLDVCIDLGIEYVSFWGFSTENWDREKEEIKVIFDIFRENIDKWKVDLVEKGVRFRHFGRKDRLPNDVVESMKELEEITKDQTRLGFQLCLDYGGRDDLVRAVNQIIREGVKEVTEDMISGYLDSRDIPDPDLIIRTSGEQRTSGFMSYQSAYAELYFTNVYFPDFDDIQLKRAILDFSSRTRRFGGTAVKDLAGIDDSKLIVPKVI